MKGDLSFWCACVFIAAGLIYVFNEIFLGERVHGETDVSWRLGEVFVWTGFSIGLLGYLRILLKSLERDCLDNREQIQQFKASFVDPSSTPAERRWSKNSVEEAASPPAEETADGMLWKTLNPMYMGRDVIEASLSIGVGVVDSARVGVVNTARVGEKTALQKGGWAVLSAQRSFRAFSTTNDTTLPSSSDNAEELRKVVPSGPEEMPPPERGDESSQAWSSMAPEMGSKETPRTVIQVTDVELRNLWEMGGMGIVMRFDVFWDAYCVFRTRFYEDGFGSRREQFVFTTTTTRQNDVFSPMKRTVKRFCRRWCPEACLKIFSSVAGDQEQGHEELKEEISIENLMQAIDEMKRERTAILHVARQTPSYWLTLIGLFAMFARAANALFQLAENAPMDASGWYLVACATGKFLGDWGALLVVIQVYQGEVKLFVKMRDILLRTVLKEQQSKNKPKPPPKSSRGSFMRLRAGASRSSDRGSEPEAVHQQSLSGSELLVCRFSKSSPIFHVLLSHTRPHNTSSEDTSCTHLHVCHTGNPNPIEQERDV